MKPLISVVIDNYNYGRFLPQALESVFSQDLPAGAVETIVVDDGSSDGSREVLERLGGRIRPIFQANQGQASAFNRGIREARGEIVCLLDSDDVWTPRKLSRVLGLLEAEPELGAVQHNLQEADGDLRPLPSPDPGWPPRYEIEDYLDGRVVFGASSGAAFRKKILGTFSPIPEELRHLYADQYLLLGSLFQSPVGNITEPLGLHRVHGGNFYAGTYADAGKLEADLAAREIFSRRVSAWLAERGLALSPRHKRLNALETLRRRVLQASLAGRKLRAAAEWARGAAQLGMDGFGLFKASTLFLAVLSPSLYLALYGLYGRSRRLRAARMRLMPEPLSPAGS